MQLHTTFKTSIFLWNLKIHNSIKNGFFKTSLKIYSSMFNSGIHGNHHTFPLLIKACAKLHSIYYGTILHSHTLLLGYQHDVYVQTSFIDMYSLCCNDLRLSRRVFDEMPVRTIVSWNAVIFAYCRNDQVYDSVMLLKELMLLGFELSSVTFVGVLSICSFALGLCVHCCVTKLGLIYLDLPLSNSVMSMYARFNQIDEACAVFYTMEEQSVVSWTAIIGGFIKAGNVGGAFSMLSKMRVQSVSLDKVIFVNLISGCVMLENLLLAMSVHSLILKSGCDCKDPINNLLVSLYAKCDDISTSKSIFDMVHDKNVFLWTSMIGAYAHSGYPREAFDLFKRMLMTNIVPNKVTVVTILSACADMGSLSVAKEIEDYIFTNGFESDLQVQTSLIHLYCKCGSIEKAQAMFERVQNKDLAVWSSMINGYAIHGMGEAALNLFDRMQLEERIKPDSGICTSILLACSYSGLVEKGLKYFKSMRNKFGIEPSLEHYTCYVDLLSRMGYVDCALKTIEEIPINVEPQVWASLISACRTYQNYELGEIAAKKLLELNPSSSSNYVSVANLYTSVGKYNDAALARASIKERGMVKEPGWSQVEIDGQYNIFTAGDRSHHRSVDIYRNLEELNVKLLETGYAANVF